MRPGSDADHTPPSSAEVKKELSYTSTHPMGPPGPVMGFPLPFYSLIYNFLWGNLTWIKNERTKRCVVSVSVSVSVSVNVSFDIQGLGREKFKTYSYIIALNNFLVVFVQLRILWFLNSLTSAPQIKEPECRHQLHECCTRIWISFIIYNIFVNFKHCSKTSRRFRKWCRKVKQRYQTVLLCVKCALFGVMLAAVP
jgi:hypothetical protein